jgi:hypothetical protein
MEALAALTSPSSGSPTSTRTRTGCVDVVQLGQRVARRLVNARWVTDGNGMRAA